MVIITVVWEEPPWHNVSLPHTTTEKAAHHHKSLPGERNAAVFQILATPQKLPLAFTYCTHTHTVATAGLVPCTPGDGPLYPRITTWGGWKGGQPRAHTHAQSLPPKDAHALIQKVA